MNVRILRQNRSIGILPMRRVYRHHANGKTQVRIRPLLTLALLLSLGGIAHAQPETKSPPRAAALLHDFQQEQAALMQERRALISQGATREQMQSWRQQNAARFQAQQQRAKAMAQASAAQPRRQMHQPNIPENASATLRDYLTTQATLANARAQIPNQLSQSRPANRSGADGEATRRQAMQSFRQQYASEIQLQAQRAQALADESARTAQPMGLPEEPMIPPDASPELASFLTQRHALMRERARLASQHADPAARHAAMQQWRQQNSARFEQLQRAVQDLSDSATAERKYESSAD